MNELTSHSGTAVIWGGKVNIFLSLPEKGFIEYVALTIVIGA